MRRPGSIIAVAVFSVALGGCERGCLSTWLQKKGMTTGSDPESPAGGGTPARPAGDRSGISLSAVDCPDGLARCGNGIVQVSRAYHYAEPCNGSPELCQCPWERVGDCPIGCAAEGAEVDLPKDRALAQLCAPSPADEAPPFAAAPPGDSIAPACDDGYVCDRGLVIACGPPARALAKCLAGCAREGQALFADEGMTDDALTPAAARAVLCTR